MAVGGCSIRFFINLCAHKNTALLYLDCLKNFFK